MHPIVVYVHGIGNKIRADSLKSQWDRALFGRDMADQSRMAYWASLRHATPLPDIRSDPLDGGVGDTEGPMAGGDREPAADFMARVLAEARLDLPADIAGIPAEGHPEGRPAVEPTGDPFGRWLGQMTHLADALAHAEETAPTDELLPLPRAARKTVFRVVVRCVFKDVHAYFYGDVGPAIREVVRRELDDLEGAPVAVIGHSFGSVVAYEVLAERGQDVELFLTLGSPLAVTEIRDHLAAPPAVPRGVRSWYNTSDLRDLVALNHTLKPAYQPEDRITEILVPNNSENHHGIREYLVNREVREPFQRLFTDLAQG
ncbi:hypothetical protein [Streptomyces sp. NPDC020965]|uniref:hypothetical protein n=1 Tax=Streptomyces sp. NPDC020965 TaxID=3365105 RepID=UPI0037981B77